MRNHLFALKQLKKSKKCVVSEPKSNWNEWKATLLRIFQNIRLNKDLSLS